MFSLMEFIFFKSYTECSQIEFLAFISFLIRAKGFAAEIALKNIKRESESNKDIERLKYLKLFLFFLL